MGPSRSSSRAPSTILTQHSDHHHRATAVTIGAVVASAVVGAVVLGLVAALLGAAWVGLLLGALIGAVAMLWVLRGAGERVLGSLGAAPIPAGGEPRLRNLVEGLCVSHGVPVPHLALLDSEGINCLAVGRSPAHTTLVFTRGLIDHLDRMELEAVAARLLGQVKSGETRLATLVAPFAGVAPGLAARALPERYDVIADLDAVGLTRYPPALVSALESTRAHSEVPTASRSSSHLWLDDPSAGATSGVAHSPIDERIATLQEL